MRVLRPIRMSRPTKRLGLCCGCIGILIAGLFLLFMTPFGGMILAVVGFSRSEAYLSRLEVYRPVGKTLALYCQSDPELFPRTLDAAWFPSLVDQFPYYRGTISESGGGIEFGGGFHHYGYSLSRDEQQSGSSVNVWHLSLYSEDASDRPLETFSLPADQKMSPEAILQQALSGYDRQIANTRDKDARSEIYQNKIALLLRFGKSQQARKTCADMLASMPDDWWARILNALIVTEEKSPAEGEQVILPWVTGQSDFFKYLDLAYYYQLENQPKKAAAAMVSATYYDANVDWGHDGNAEYRGYPAAMYAFQSGEYPAAIALCDKLMAVTVNGNYAKSSLQALREAAQKRARGEKASVTWSGEMSHFEPFRKLDMDTLLKKHLPLPKPTE